MHLEAAGGALVGDLRGVAAVALRGAARVVVRRGHPAVDGGLLQRARAAVGRPASRGERVPRVEYIDRIAAARPRTAGGMLAAARPGRPGAALGAFPRHVGGRATRLSAMPRACFDGLLELRDQVGHHLGDRAHLVHPADDLADRHRDRRPGRRCALMRLWASATSRFCSGIGSGVRGVLLVPGLGPLRLQQPSRLAGVDPGPHRVGRCRPAGTPRAALVAC